MNKNFFRTCIGLTVGVSLLIASTIMGIASGPTGYEALKAALKNSDKIENATYRISGTVIDNDEEMMKLNSTLKVQAENLVSGNFSIETGKIGRSYTFSVQDETTVLKDNSSDVYSKIILTQKENELKASKYENPQAEAILESIVDNLVGDLKNQVILKNLGDDEKQISINLEKDEIPALFNLILNLRQTEDNIEIEPNNRISEILGFTLKDFEFPKLTSNIQAEKINIEIIVDRNNTIKEMGLEFEISGNDAQNNIHNRKFNINYDIFDIYSTTADIIELNGKEVKEFSSEELNLY